MSRQIPSTEFRVKYHVLTEPVEVTVLGRVIGRYIPTPYGRYWEPEDDPTANYAPGDGETPVREIPEEKA
jgi:hypothetical protein